LMRIQETKRKPALDASVLEIVKVVEF